MAFVGAAAAPLRCHGATARRERRWAGASGTCRRFGGRAAMHMCESAPPKDDATPSVSPSEGGGGSGGGADKSMLQQLVEAAQKQDIDTVDRLLAEDFPADTVDESGRTALHYVSALGATPRVRRLIEQGAPIDRQDATGFTPLHMAAGYARPSTVDALLEKGADATLRSKRGELALDIVERLLRNTPEKRFFLPNKKHTTLKEISLMLKPLSRRGGKQLGDGDDAA